MSVKDYEIDLNGVDPANLDAVTGVLESHSHLFEDYFLAGYGGDASYSVIDGTFEVVSIGENYFEYEVGINFFAGCRDMNDSHEDTGLINYEVRDGCIHIELDDSIWRLDN
ncbi:TPA: hypothetical protein MFX78_23235 [Klebsiella pneumoniae]|jgi:hypothetical protein|uniref:hypothetical protein n=1 Tax=Klebsiella pneumoniae complex TaxID=3390273 RepID=UPI000E2D4428|nr:MULTISPECIES: hypothetical protein [Klebsiella]HBT2411617.1 hypothetical protein [Klebsiella pneumoniae subsp. pneumoniae]EKZ9585596.1 hypothetical protein [Klebsiella pneumoniae]MCD9729074.1 hypothetical protein [Klebsiella pneumoniae]MCU8625423.1 hypothetical protein [Klebsiella pneumoniae]MCU8703066.1 hypothetical protein [Klebsiella pneumoniae]